MTYDIYPTWIQKLETLINYNIPYHIKWDLVKIKSFVEEFRTLQDIEITEQLTIVMILMSMNL